MGSPIYSNILCKTVYFWRLDRFFVKYINESSCALLCHKDSLAFFYSDVKKISCHSRPVLILISWQVKSRRLGENPLQKLIHTLTIQLNHERRNVIARRVICSVDKSRALKSGLRNNGASEEGYRPAMVKATRVSPLFPRHVPFFRSFNPRERCSPLHGARRVRSLRSHVGINQLERRTARSAGWLTTSGFVSQLGQAATRAYGSPLLARNTATEARAVRDRVRHDRGENRSTRSIDRCPTTCALNLSPEAVNIALRLPENPNRGPYCAQRARLQRT